VCAAEKGQNTLIVALLGESAREGLWYETSLLLEKGQDVLLHKAEPMIYLSGARDKIVLASYTPRGSRTDRDRLVKNAPTVEGREKAKAKKSAKSRKVTKKKTKKAPKTLASSAKGGRS
jgi:hypothetical protein